MLSAIGHPACGVIEAIRKPYTQDSRVRRVLQELIHVHLSARIARRIFALEPELL